MVRIINLVLAICYIFSNAACNDFQSDNDIKNLTKDGQKIIDSIMSESNKKYQPYRYADSLVNADHTLAVLVKLDSLIKLYPNDHLIYICKGDWYYKNGEYSNALNEYNNSAKIAQDESPQLLDKKAKAYIELNNLAEATNCYKKAAAMNYDYYFSLAQSYELSNKIDSSIKYYSIYIKHYPAEQHVKYHMDSLIADIKK